MRGLASVCANSAVTDSRKCGNYALPQSSIIRSSARCPSRSMNSGNRTSGGATPSSTTLRTESARPALEDEQRIGQRIPPQRRPDHHLELDLTARFRRPVLENGILAAESLGRPLLDLARVQRSRAPGGASWQPISARGRINESARTPGITSHRAFEHPGSRETLVPQASSIDVDGKTTSSRKSHAVLCGFLAAGRMVFCAGTAASGANSSGGGSSRTAPFSGPTGRPGRADRALPG